VEQAPSNNLLTVIEALRAACGDVSLAGVVLFLHVCEHDGISIKDLVFLSGYGESLVSRAVDRLSRTEKGDMGAALVRVTRHPGDGRRRLVHLTDAGLALRARIAGAFAGSFGGPRDLS
jgi:DNA-binding MarR family transcriptional regulator